MSNPKYQSPNWQKKRLEILSAADYKCCKCGNGEDQLHIHHIVYHAGHEPWEYNNTELQCLCSQCHTAIESAIIRLRWFAARCPSGHVEQISSSLLQGLDRAEYQHPTNILFHGFLAAMKQHVVVNVNAVRKYPSASTGDMEDDISCAMEQWMKP